MALLERRKALGTLDRMLVANDPGVDGPITADGPLATKWADMAHLRSTEECVISDATPTEFCLRAKLCREAMTLVVCQTVAAEGQAVQYELEGSNDDFATSEVLSSATVIGASEALIHADNSLTIDGVEEYFTKVRISVTLNGAPIEAWVYLVRGIC